MVENGCGVGRLSGIQEGNGFLVRWIKSVEEVF